MSKALLSEEFLCLVFNVNANGTITTAAAVMMPKTNGPMISGKSLRRRLRGWADMKATTADNTYFGKGRQ
jgi:hypothetical protein